MAYLKALFKKRKLIDESTENLSMDDLYLTHNSNVRVYYLRTGTVFQNTLAFERIDERFLIFPNASQLGTYAGEKVPFMAGDYVDLGFFLRRLH